MFGRKGSIKSKEHDRSRSVSRDDQWKAAMEGKAPTATTPPPAAFIDGSQPNASVPDSTVSANTGSHSPAVVVPQVQVEGPSGEMQAVQSSNDLAQTDVVTKPAMAQELLPLLVYTAGVTFRGLGPNAGYAPSQVFSLSENRAKSLIHNPNQDVKDALKTSAKDSALLVEHTRGHVVRVYPKGTRVDSSNYEPNVFWAMGCQLVAMNWQTVDRGWHINRALFLRNGGAGYVLKPPALLDPAYPSDKEKHPHTKHVLRVRVISAQQLPRPKDHQGYEVIDKDTVDPYVKVTVHIPIWAGGKSNEKIAPVPIRKPSDQPDPSQQQLKPGETKTTSVAEEGVLIGSAGVDVGDEQAGAAVGEREVKMRTKTIRNNGFNPVWDEELKLPFDVFGEGMMDTVFVRFLVKDDNMEKDDFVGGYCASLGCLEMGYRHLPLYDEQVSQILFAGLFVHLSIEDL